MAALTEAQVVLIKQHMLHETDALNIKYKAKKCDVDTMKVLHAEVEAYENQGWIAGIPMRTRTPMTRRKRHDVKFEDDIWCMFYNLGFRILNADEKLRIQWGNNPGEDKQVDVVAVGEDAIFVVECKCAESPRVQSFQQTLIEISSYKDGMAESLRQIYGKEKRVKFIFATRNYRIKEDGDDDKRMKQNDIYHLDENVYNYICNLIKSYQTSVVYQFYGLMFKDELINNNPITIPALKGTMGGRNYYLFSIEPSTLLKIGFVLHRTKVNDSMAPTYQRLLLPKRLKGITKFIDEGGYFPNSIIINFADPTSDLKVTFDPIHKEDASDAEFGLLNIPNAYGIAYIIDGQHRVYGYSNSKFKDTHTIPVVAFQNMANEEQLQIFMEINENQKSVSKNLRIDLEEDLFWTSKLLDSRMKALRSSTIKLLAGQSGNVLYGKISIGEDQADLSSVSFDRGLFQSGLIPKASKTRWLGSTETSLYEIEETNIDKAMKDARKRIVQFLDGCYSIAEEKMNDATKKTFLFSNRATYPFIVLSGLLHSYLYTCGQITKGMPIKDRIQVIMPYVETLCDGLNNIPEDEAIFLKGIQGQGAEKKWLLAYQNIVNKKYPDYFPEELKEWKEMRDQDLQNQGQELKEDIRKQLRIIVFLRLEEAYGAKWQNKVSPQKNAVESRLIKSFSDDDNFDLSDYDWRDYVDITEYKDIISNNFAHPQFEEVFAINTGAAFRTKSDKIAWLLYVMDDRNTAALTRSDNNRLELINSHLQQYMPIE